MSRQPQVTLTNTFGLSCIVEADFSHLRVPLTVTWQFQPARSQVFYLLVRIAWNGTIEWGDFLSQFQKKTKLLQSSFYSQLLIHDATEEEAGVYRCQVEVYARNSPDTSGPPRASAVSHSLMIAITLPGKHHLKLTHALKTNQHISPMVGKFVELKRKIPSPHVLTV